MYYKKMSNKSLTEILSSFNELEKKDFTKTKPFTLWLPEEYKVRYDVLQAKSSRQFTKVIRDLVMYAIDETDHKD
jgi:hypothetical protein